MNQYLIECLSICQQVSDSGLARQSHQPMTWKTGGKSIAHLFQAISYTSDIIESEQLHHMFSLPSSLIMSYCMTNRMWVRQLYFFPRHSHQSCLIPWPTVGEWDCFMSLPGTLMNHVSSHNQQGVRLLYFSARHSHESCLIPWPTGSEWDCFIYLPVTLMNHVSSHDWQSVSETALFIYQALSSVMSHLMTNSGWVRMLYFSARHSHWLCLIPWLTGSEWDCFIYLPVTLMNHVPSHDQQRVSEIVLLICQALSSTISHPMTNSKWVRLLHFFARHSH